jgi:hypothetical protein
MDDPGDVVAAPVADEQRHLERITVRYKLAGKLRPYNIRSFESRPAVDGSRECCADLTHALVTEPAQTFDERSERHTLDGVEVDR